MFRVIAGTRKFWFLVTPDPKETAVAKTDEELRTKHQELTDRDAEQIAQIRAYGVDPGQRRQVDLTFWAPDEATAKLFAKACTRNEMPPHTVLGPGATEVNRRWLVRCSITASVNFMTDRDNIGTFILFADKFDSEYDGWGTSIVEVMDPSSVRASV